VDKEAMMLRVEKEAEERKKREEEMRPVVNPMDDEQDQKPKEGE
jgi:hypothetical protein